MKIVVLKFGGTSVGTVDRIKKVANIIIGYVKKRYKVIVISSAMSGTTNDLIKKSKNIDIVIEHPTGSIDVVFEMEGDEIKNAGIVRTARKLFSGEVYIANFQEF